ncbi:deoxyribodipyrimidine photo-lyase [Carnobacterium divergens]|uniref:Deoxyribodipyrimidine photo-lyase n=1 Tax=Carnobacterium divergens TaxID=2748 RepID=A0A7Z8CZ13_CARDV|nr:deoxyribodipyrimidine photo-lyase [Carnobacterium divergens]TFI72486.1 deoxyribodipyrimidine photolyase [Carnobacterium divergens]TFI76793.1 deoxyribodipyrimidine photolyase [Carnobacterium divergens]TFI83215.1 deoxyribodipyrimidine photolyase [Carnobacterium divergens]TFI94844.1 deoxyribodipyrimidine photolyase [Carnobacterium divergens]TFJ11387.1 deoxyribodipyrimidine photolyase [Carnobacterium divergens]
MSGTITGMWFRKDLRLVDNTALIAMMKERDDNESVIGIFNINPSQLKKGTLNHQAFFAAVEQFSEEAEKAGLPIHFIVGKPEKAFETLKKAIPELTKIYFNRDERGYGKKRDEAMLTFFSDYKIQVNHFQDSHLHGVSEIKKDNGEAFKVFTPYYNRWKKLKKPLFQKEEFADFGVKGADFRQLFKEEQKYVSDLLAEIPIELKGEVGLQRARGYLSRFIDKKVSSYEVDRDYPAIKGTSRISRFLRTGELSIREVYHRLNDSDEGGNSSDTFLKELCWRDFYNMIYAENPEQQTLEIKEQYRGLHWNQNQGMLIAWKEGKTGFPIVDAGMRQLNQTGWMHNRLRMIVASFLTKDLLTDWRLGEAYFSQQLVDYDSASNIGGWQWAASTGTDAVPYFRIFNPTLQGKNFDSDGTFIRFYVPELANVPIAYLHEPQKMPLDIQKQVGCIIGTDYPEPIVDHQKMRSEILSLFKGQ